MQPKVMALMLTADRPQFINAAVGCFKAQTYEARALLIYDSGVTPANVQHGDGVYHEHHPEDRGLTIGALRNLAMAFAHPLCLNADIVAHFDVDDWSHGNRLTEQVALLQASGADVAGMNEMLFWRHLRVSEEGPRVMNIVAPEAWLYANHRPNFALGTSLCYWRKTWEAKPFEDIPRPGDMEGEDGRFLRGLNVTAVSGLPIVSNGHTVNTLPMMIARIHGGNTSDQYREIAQSDNWKRVPEWDNRLREMMG